MKRKRNVNTGWLPIVHLDPRIIGPKASAMVEKSVTVDSNQKTLPPDHHVIRLIARPVLNNLAIVAAALRGGDKSDLARAIGTFFHRHPMTGHPSTTLRLLSMLFATNNVEKIEFRRQALQQGVPEVANRTYLYGMMSMGDKHLQRLTEEFHRLDTVPATEEAMMSVA